LLRRRCEAAEKAGEPEANASFIGQCNGRHSDEDADHDSKRLESLARHLLILATKLLARIAMMARAGQRWGFVNSRANFHLLWRLRHAGFSRLLCGALMRMW
jgi:hypothetical protein